MYDIIVLYCIHVIGSLRKWFIWGCEAINSRGGSTIQPRNKEHIYYDKMYEQKATNMTKHMFGMQTGVPKHIHSHTLIKIHPKSVLRAFARACHLLPHRLG